MKKVKMVLVQKQLILIPFKEFGQRPLSGTRPRSQSNDDSSCRANYYKYRTFSQVWSGAQAVGSGVTALLREARSSRQVFGGICAVNRHEWLASDLGCAIYGHGRAEFCLDNIGIWWFTQLLHRFNGQHFRRACHKPASFASVPRFYKIIFSKYQASLAAATKSAPPSRNRR